MRLTPIVTSCHFGRLDGASWEPASVMCSEQLVRVLQEAPGADAPPETGEAGEGELGAQPGQEGAGVQRAVRRGHEGAEVRAVGEPPERGAPARVLAHVLD